MAKKMTSAYQMGPILELAALSLYVWQESYQPSLDHSIKHLYVWTWHRNCGNCA